MTIRNTKTTQNQEISSFSVPKRDYDPYNQEQYNPVKGEIALWTAVITQALMDAGSESRKPEAKHEKAKAIRWLLGNSEDFATVCQNAGLDPHCIRKKAVKAIERGCVWRRGMAEKRQANEAHADQLPATEKKYYIPVRANSQPIHKRVLSKKTTAYSSFAALTTAPRAQSYTAALRH